MFRHKKSVWLFLLPGATGLMLFYIVPFVGGIYYSLTDGSWRNEFVGMKNYIDINRQQKLAERNNYKSAIALFHYDYKIERAVQYETLAKERVKKRTGIEREGEDDSYLAWNVGSEKSHFHLLSKFSIITSCFYLPSPAAFSKLCSAAYSTHKQPSLENIFDIKNNKSQRKVVYLEIGIK